MTTALLVLLFLKLPVFVAIPGTSAVYFVLTSGISLAVFVQQAITGAEGVTPLAIPFFVCIGVLMNYAGVTKRTTDFCTALTGRMYGRLSQVNILLSMPTGGLSGSAPADVAMEAKMLVPGMEKKGIGRALLTAVMAAPSMITPLIPPEVRLIPYGCIASVSIGKLFVAGSGPGVLLCTTMMLMVSRISKKWGHLPLRTEKIHPSMFRKSFRPVVLPLCLPIIIIDGTYLGVFTVTEADSVVIVYTAILGIVYRELGFREVAQDLRETLQVTSSIMLVAAAVSTFSWTLTKEAIPWRFAEWMIQMINNKWIFLVAVDIFLTFVGVFVEGDVNMTVLVPLFAPVAMAHGIDPTHFVMVFIFANAIGAFTPPIGTLMSAACGVTRYPARDFIKEAAPFYTLSFGCLLILTSVSLFSTGLVNLVYWRIIKWRRFRGRRRHY